MLKKFWYPIAFALVLAIGGSFTLVFTVGPWWGERQDKTLESYTPVASQPDKVQMIFDAVDINSRSLKFLSSNLPQNDK